ncbi:MAG: MerR family transcriptional regulator [Candidatus Babeliales bacterium]
MQSSKIKMNKRQFRIGELAKELKVKKFVIRFWEKEFDLQSDRSSGGQRFYTYNDLQTFLTIKNLLYDKKFTISGAKLQLKNINKEIENMINIESDIKKNNLETDKINPAQKVEFQDCYNTAIKENQEIIEKKIETKEIFEYQISQDILEKINLLKKQLINLRENL